MNKYYHELSNQRRILYSMRSGGLRVDRKVLNLTSWSLICHALTAVYVTTFDHDLGYCIDRTLEIV